MDGLTASERKILSALMKVIQHQYVIHRYLKQDKQAKVADDNLREAIRIVNEMVEEKGNVKPV